MSKEHPHSHLVTKALQETIAKNEELGSLGSQPGRGLITQLICPFSVLISSSKPALLISPSIQRTDLSSRNDPGRRPHPGFWTYNKALNQWAAHFVYPEEAATEGWAIGAGPVQGPVRTKDVQTTDPAADRWPLMLMVLKHS